MKCASSWAARRALAGRLPALKKIKVSNLRWPGGCYADAYHWRDGIGPAAQRPPRINIWWGDAVEDNSFGTHEFLELCGLIGCEPYLAANVGSGTVEEMASWMEYLNANAVTPLTQQRVQNGHPAPYQVMWWGIGNESWGCGGNMTPEYYTDVYKCYATFAHDYPGSLPLRKIVSGANSDNEHWTETCMKIFPSIRCGASRCTNTPCPPVTGTRRGQPRALGRTNTSAP